MIRERLMEGKINSKIHRSPLSHGTTCLRLADRFSSPSYARGAASTRADWNVSRRPLAEDHLCLFSSEADDPTGAITLPSMAHRITWITQNIDYDPLF
jgi:hypothetical protein